MGWIWKGKCGLGPKRAGGKGDREGQKRRESQKRRQARAAAREAAGKPKSKGGRTPGSHSKQQCQKAAWMIRRRLHGKQPPLGLTAFARAAQAKVTHAHAVMADSVAKERAAVAVAQSAEQGASVALDQKEAAEAQAKDALKYADKVWTKYKYAPPFFG